MKPSDVYEKYCNGDNLTDSEVLDGMKFFSDLAAMLSISGPVFKLAFLEANRISERLIGMVTARKLYNPKYG